MSVDSFEPITQHTLSDTPQFAIEETSVPDDEISLLDIGVAIARKRQVVAWTTILFVLVGLIIAISAPPEYRSSMTVMSELGGEGSTAGGLGSTLRSFGFSLPGGGTGGTLTAQAIPDIVASRQVRLAVARDTFFFPEIGETTTLVDFLSRDPGLSLGSMVAFVKSWTFGLPGKVLRLFQQSPNEPTAAETPTSFLTREESDAIAWVGAAVQTTEDIGSGLITLSATVPDPLVASQLVTSTSEALRSRVQMVYTNKTRQNLDFVERQFQRSRGELDEADRALAEFKDRNQSLTSSRVQLEEQRLQREVTFKSQLYSELQAQLTQAQIELQQSEPVITTIEDATPPLGPSGPNRKLTVILAFLLGGIVGLGLALASSALEAGQRDPESSAKLAEIRAALPGLPRFLRRN